MDGSVSASPVGGVEQIEVETQLVIRPPNVQDHFPVKNLHCNSLLIWWVLFSNSNAILIYYEYYYLVKFQKSKGWKLILSSTSLFNKTKKYIYISLTLKRPN